MKTTRTDPEKAMNNFTKLLLKLRKIERIRSSKSSSKRSVRNRLSLERLEERSLMAVVAAWSAENTAVDSVGSNNGTLIGGATFSPGQVGQSFRFDGVDDRIGVADSPSLALTGSISIEAWVKASAYPATGTGHGLILFRGDDRGGLDPYQLTLREGGVLSFDIASLTGGAGVQAPLPLGQFVHVAGTLDDATGQMKLYMNGVLVSQIVTSLRPFGALDPASNPGIGIGSHGGYPATPHKFLFNGLIDELKLYDHALSQAEVLANFDASKGSLQPSLTLSIADVAVTEGRSHFNVGMPDLVTEAGSGGLARSTAMTYGPDGNLYVGNFLLNGEILKYSPSGTFLGKLVSDVNNGGLGTPAVDGIIFRPDGMLYVASRDNANVLRFNATTGAFIDEFIVKGSGGLSQIKGMEFGSDGNIYLSSAGTNQILRFSGSTGAYLGAFVAAGSGGLQDPRSITFGPDSHLYVSSARDNSVKRYNGTTGAFIDAFIPSKLGGLLAPADLLFKNGNLYVASQSSNQVLRFDATTGAYMDAVDPANSVAMDRPIGLLAAADGSLLVGSFGKIHRLGESTNAVVAVSLSSYWPIAVTVDYQTANVNAQSGADYLPTSGSLTFLPGGPRIQSIVIPTLDDLVYEGNETFSIVLSSPVGATLSDSIAIATILDNELPPTKFYVVNDGSPDRTYEYGASGTAIENYAIQSTNTAPRGAASTAAGDKVWVVDGNKKVYVYDTSGGLLGSWSAGSLASNATVEGITTNGTDVWIVDSRSDRVFKYAGAATRTSGSQNAASSFSLHGSNSSPTDLVTDGSSIWVLNNTLFTDKVFKYSVGGSLQGSWTITSGGGSPTGLTIDPTNVSNIWVVDNNTDRVYQFDAATSRTSGSASPTSSFPLAAGNTNPQGIADPPSPSTALASRATKIAVGVATPEVVKPIHTSLAYREPYLADIDSFFENWTEDRLSSKAQRRLAGRR